MLCNFLLARTSCINFLALSRESASPSLGIGRSRPDWVETVVVAIGVAGAGMGEAGTVVRGNGLVGIGM